MKIPVELAPNGYAIHVGPGLLSAVPGLLAEAGCAGKSVIVTDPLVRKMYGASLEQRLNGAGFQTAVLELPIGERYKSLETAGRLYQELTDFGAERQTPVLALGGGVIGDVAGFVAATYLRGVPLFQVPTTLLAQVDSSIGGKVAVNHGRLKNKIGAFYQPRAVIADINTLKTLPSAELASGLGEVIKYAVIRDGEFFNYLEAELDRIQALDDEVLERTVSRCARIKAEVVERDERDLGLRNILNFGHTVGHAIETVSDFGLGHGQCVSIGMMAASQIAAQQGMFAATDAERLGRLLDRAGLPTRMPQLPMDRVLEAMTHDKKVAGGKVRFVLPRAIGEVVLADDIHMKLVEEVLAGMK